MSIILDWILCPPVIISLSCLILFIIFYCTPRPPLPDLPFVGLRNEWFPKTRCRWRSTISYRKASQDAYNHYSLKGLPCILLTLTENKVILPPTLTNWIIGQPDHALDVKPPQLDSLQLDYTLGDPGFTRLPYHEYVARTDLNRHLKNLTPVIQDELAASFDETWGLDTTTWRSICVYESMLEVISRATSRVIVGLPLCRNSAYTRCARQVSEEIPLLGMILSSLPSLLRPIVAPIITLPFKIHSRKLQSYLGPETRSRLSQTKPEKSDGQSPSNDFLQWQIKYAQEKVREKSQPEELSFSRLAVRLSAINFASIHTSTITITNAVFDLASADPSLKYAEHLREEAATVSAEANGTWTKTALSKMYKIDSALREPMRLRSFMIVAMTRRVVAKDGLSTPNGLHLPYGTDIGVSSYGVHNDEKNYPRPSEYNALRSLSQNASIDQTEKNRFSNASGFAATGATYQGFGHGRRACPGRFFVADEMKLMLAYMFLNYDIEPLKERPMGSDFGATALPPMKACIRIRR